MQIAGLYASGSNGQEDIYRYLDKLLKDEKNEEYQDQIYYQYAMLELNKGNNEKAIDYFNKSE